METQKQKHLKSDEGGSLLKFALTENLFCQNEVSEGDFISAGTRVYRFDDYHVVKLNDSIFYEYWLDYNKGLLIHNYFLKFTAYDFLVFKIVSGELFAVLKEAFIIANESTDLSRVNYFLAYNHFKNNRNNDYISPKLDIIFEDPHDENVLSCNGILYFIDTVFISQKVFTQIIKQDPKNRTEVGDCLIFSPYLTTGVKVRLAGL